ncbi:MAG: TMEM165/GDT1 family protein [Actinomycetota bacterium]
MFLLELPDKTMIATVVMATKARPLAVSIGAASAFIVQMALACAAGGLLTLLPSRIKELIIGVLFLAGAAYLLLVKEKDVEAEGEREAKPEHRASFTREALTAFGVIFIGEFGDLTQIQAANLVAKTHQPVMVFAASSIGLVAVTFLASYGGSFILRKVPLSLVRKFGGVVFAGLGLYTLVHLVVA